MNPFKRSKNDQQPQIVVLDTSGLIDGRIVEIAKAGFIPPNIVVPQFVIAELQFLADHGDTHKRGRARYGLDVIRELQEIRRVEVAISREKFNSIKEVDDKLVALAKQYGALLYTTDFNLNKVAQIEGVAVLNVNELAHALRPNLLPGERVTIKLTQAGQDKTQGVGYLSDGTMVVVEQAARYIGQQVTAVCTRILQTQAGKMMFATLAPGAVGRPVQPQHAKPPEVPRQPQPKVKPQPTQQQPKKQPLAGQPAQQHRHHQKQASQMPQQKQQPGNGGQQSPAKKSNRPHAQQRPRSQVAKKHLSPEDSLLATLNEIER